MLGPASSNSRAAVHSTWLAGLALLLATLLAHLPALSAGWLWDDDALVLNSCVQAGDGLSGIWAGEAPQEYVPLTTTLYWLEFRLWGANASGFHAVALALHAAAVLALWRVLVALRLPGAWWGALLFAVHPLTVASVAWAAETKNMLALLLAALATRAWIAWLDGGCRRMLGWSVAAFVATLLAKPALVMLPCVLLLIAWCRMGTGSGAADPASRSAPSGAASARRPDVRRPGLRRRDVLASVPFFVVAFVLGLVTVHFQHTRTLGAGLAGSESTWLRVAAAGASVWWYLGKALLPLDLTVVYSRWAVDPSRAMEWLPLAALLLALVLLLRSRRREARAVGVGLAAFALLLLPALGIVEMSYMAIARVSDHFAYPALIVPCALVAAAGATGAAGRTAARMIVVLGAAVAVALGGASFSRARLYENQVSLFSDNVRRVPGAWLAHNNLGGALLARGGPGDAAAAEPHLREAIRLHPAYPEPRNNLGALLLDAGRLDEARVQLDAALGVSPDMAAAHLNLGRLLLQENRPADAVESLRRAVELDPLAAVAHNVLGVALAQQDDASAEQSFRRALELRPDFPEALNNLGRWLLNRGELAEAESCLRGALALKPDYAAARENLAEVTRARGK